MEFTEIELVGEFSDDYLGAEFTRCIGSPDFRASGGMEYTVHLNCVYEKANFSGVNLRASVFDECTFIECVFDNAHIRGVLFNKCAFSETYIIKAADRTGVIVQ